MNEQLVEGHVPELREGPGGRPALVCTACLACHQSPLSPVRAYRSWTRAGRALFRDVEIGECLGCGLVQVNRRPIAPLLAAYHSSRHLYPGSDVRVLREFPKDHQFYFNRGESAATLLQAHIDRRDPTIFDGGAGYGHLLHALGRRYHGSPRMAAELSKVGVRHLRALGCQVFAEPVETALRRFTGQLDVVLLSHVLDHLLDPLEALRHAHRALVPGGLLYIEVPNSPTKSGTRYADHIWIPRFDEPHITFFSTRTLPSLVTAAGFEVRFCETVGPLHHHVSRVRFRLPQFRRLLEGLLPPRLVRALRRQRFTGPLRARENQDAFYRYGGPRLWIRCVATAVAAAAT